MNDHRSIRVLLVEDNPDFAKLVDLFLKKHEPETFTVAWKESGADALHELGRNPMFDVILMDYFLPGQNGVEVTRALQSRGIHIPIIFLTVNKDFDLAVEVMKLGVEDYLVKEEISTPVLPKTILSVIERQQLKEELTRLEISQKRLEAIHELIATITGELRTPLDGMRHQLEELLRLHQEDGLKSYLAIIRDNLDRIEKKIVKLKELKTDKTVQYIKDIRMFDLSEESVEEIVPIGPIVGGILRDFETSLCDRSVVVRTQENFPHVRFDSADLHVVFNVLISNAIKFADKPHPVIDIGYEEEEHEYQFWVKDNGKGVEQHDRERIFLGSGLRKAKEIVEREGGRIWIESTPSEGAIFFFTIKKKPVGGAQAANG
ncbi:MAG: hypothetical protein C4326_03135 [Ignavibacteria bacterium]